jgi:hypothetical protein
MGGDKESWDFERVKAELCGVLRDHAKKKGGAFRGTV